MYRSIFEESLDGILAIDKEDKIISYNTKFIELWGIPEEIIKTKSDEKALQFVLNKLKNPKEFIEKVKYLYSTLEKSNEEVYLVDGRVFDRYSSPIFDENKVHCGRVWFFRDVSEHKKQEKKIMHAEKLASLGLLATSIAHEINNPLTVLAGNISILKGKCKNLCEANCPQHTDMCTKACDRIAKIINDLQTFARPNTDYLGKIDIQKGILDTLALVEAIFKKDNIEITTDFCNNSECVGNPSKIQQVIMNLIINAKDAIKETSKPGNIKIKTDRTSEYLIITITDTGSGINPQDLTHIWDLFYTTKPIGKGTGLGLPLSKDIIESMGGEIKVQSEKNVGTTFTITLPLESYKKAA